jgi:hypothetical protein
MDTLADQSAQNVFQFSEYFLIPKPTGKKAANLRELMEHLQEMSEPVLECHLWQSHLSYTQPEVDIPLTLHCGPPRP